MNGQPRFNMRLGVIGAPAHWIGPDGRYRAYEPYVREMRVWADLFSQVVVCGHAGEQEMKGNLAPYERENIEVRAVRYTRDYGFSGMRRRLVQLPGLILNARRTIRDCDFILLRSPSHFGLVGAALVRAMGRRSITKWAGENARYKGERIPSRINRFLEGLPGDLHVMLVYGESRRPNQISFLPALMSVEELALARDLARQRTWEPPWKILCVGRLERAKNFDLALRALGELHRRRPDLDWTFTLIGDGTEKRSLQVLAAECEIADRVTLTGALAFRDVQEQYGRAHIAIMPGVKEGWPKIIAEAWAHGAFPVASRAGIVPWILNDRESGTVVNASQDALADALADALSDPARLRALSKNLHAYAEQLSLDHFKHRLERVLVERCGLQ
jgi:glycosyltransferase involved in cell wall biosynthesis